MSETTTNSTSVHIRGEWLCGEGNSLFDPAISWDTEEPSLGVCLRKVVWTFPPFLVVYASLPFYLRSLVKSESRGTPLSTIGKKTFLSISILLTHEGFVKLFDLLGRRRLANLSNFQGWDAKKNHEISTLGFLSVGCLIESTSEIKKSYSGDGFCALTGFTTQISLTYQMLALMLSITSK